MDKQPITLTPTIFGEGVSIVYCEYDYSYGDKKGHIRVEFYRDYDTRIHFNTKSIIDGSVYWNTNEKWTRHHTGFVKSVIEGHNAGSVWE